MTELFSVTGLAKTYETAQGRVEAVKPMSLSLNRGETLAIIGESGSGKSTLGRMLVGLENSDQEMRRVTAAETTMSRVLPKAPMVFQDSLGSLNPRRTTLELIAEPLLIRDGKFKLNASSRAAAERIASRVGLPRELWSRFPHEMSGGQRQRVNIGRALVLEPEWCLLDEPVSALDVSIQAQIINLLLDLKRDQNLALIFISHDIALTRFLADRVLVLYRGEVVEMGPTRDVLESPKNKYTQLLLQSEPVL